MSELLAFVILVVSGRLSWHFFTLAWKEFSND